MNERITSQLLEGADQAAFREEENVDSVKNTVSITLQVEGTLNVARARSEGFSVRQVSVKNVGDQPIEGAELLIQAEGGVLLEHRHKMGEIKPGRTWDHQCTLRVGMPGAPMSEEYECPVVAQVWYEGAMIGSCSMPVTVLPVDQWDGKTDKTLAAFVQPNDSQLAPVRARAAELLLERTGLAAFDGYCGGAARAREQVEALFDALAEVGLAYALPPASFARGQRIRLAGDVLQGKIGTCIDLSCLMASLLESVRIEPVLVTTSSHAVAGFWLKSGLAHAQMTDEDEVRSLFESCGGDLVLIECTHLAQQHATLEAAAQAGFAHFEQAGVFECLIDVKNARLEGVHPLPQLIVPAQAPGDVSAGAPAVAPEVAPVGEPGDASDSDSAAASDPATASDPDLDSTSAPDPNPDPDPAPAWPPREPTRSDLAKELVQGRPVEGAHQMLEPAGRLSPMGLTLPLSADSSQLHAVRQAARGVSFVMDGPPGAGKSQTIANIVVNSMLAGQSVLVVSEKEAALDVDAMRLHEAGVGGFLLPMYGKAPTASVLSCLEGALEMDADQAKCSDVALRENVRLTRALDGYAHALERPVAEGLTLREAIGRALHARSAPDVVTVSREALARIRSQAALAETRAFIERLGSAAQALGSVREHPLALCAPKECTALTLPTLQAAIAECVQALEVFEAAHVRMADLAGVPAPRKQADYVAHQHAAVALAQWCGREAALAVLQGEEFDRFMKRVAVRPQARALAEGALQAVRADAPVLDAAAQCLDAAPAFARAQEGLGSFVALLRAASSDSWVPSLRETLVRLEEAADDLPAWRAWRSLADEAKLRGLDSAVLAFEQGFSIEEVRASFEKALYGAWCEQAIAGEAELRDFSGAVLDRMIEQYRRTEDVQMAKARYVAHETLVSRARATREDALLAEQVSGLKRVLQTKGRGVTLRQVTDAFRNVVQGLCPCVLATPASLEEHWSEEARFDVVLFDEASQLETVRAVCAIDRVSQAIVVGDQQQMPPSRYFAKATDVDFGGDMEQLACMRPGRSLLEDCLAIGVPRLSLRWHYRSRHESLISFSNHCFYGGSLRTFPSADDRVSKVRLEKVEGRYDGKGVNRAEAEAIVVRLRECCAAGDARSFGIVTFNVRQRGVIESLLSQAYADDPAFEQWARGSETPLFVRNLENVQGDERDVIVLSVTYGPDERGVVSQHFGPINHAGGERRLNVAFTRACCEVMVFSTMTAAQIVDTSQMSRGARALKAYLHYAEFGGSPEDALRVAGLFEAPARLVADGCASLRDESRSVAEALAAALEEAGWHAVCEVGSSQVKVDIAVVDPADPERYLAGILLDGASYRSAQTTRDRDMGRDEVLQGLGWNLMHVWSVDCFNSFGRELRRVLKFLDERVQASKQVDA